MINTMSKIRGQVKTTGYPQTEGLLGESMLRYGRELGEESEFGEWVSCVAFCIGYVTCLMTQAMSSVAAV